MRIFDLLSMTFKNLMRRKMRTVLTVTGVVVGTCSIVVMVSLGIGQMRSMEESIAQMGDLTLINIYSYGGGSAPNTEQAVLNDAAMHKILNLPGVKGGTPMMDSLPMEARIYSGKKDRYEMYLWNLRGIYANQAENMGFNLREGEFLPAQPEKGKFSKGKKVKLLFGKSMAYEFTDTKRSGQAAFRWEGMTDPAGNPMDPFVDPMKDKLTLVLPCQEYKEDGKPKYSDLRFEVDVTGILGPPIGSDPNQWDENSYAIYIDIQDYRDLYAEYKKAFKIRDENSDREQNLERYNTAKIKVDSIDNVEAVDKAIKDMGFETQSLNSIREPMMKQMHQQQLFLGGIGAISLLVAAIGISNTMVMSIYERTREIGVMKVLGCQLGNIRSVFLMEAGFIGFFGGVAGVGISYGLSSLINYLVRSGLLSSEGTMGGMLGGMGTGMGGDLSVIPFWLALCAVAFATLIGLVSGFSPANRAVKISALEAIKHE